jgi:hypothetical protein
MPRASRLIISSGTLSFASDGHGGTVITDPPATSSCITSVSVGGVGGDTFAFTPGVGADTVVNFNPRVDAIELDHFANVHVQQLASLITQDAHGDALIELGHHNGIALPGVTARYLQAHLSNIGTC